MNCSEIEGLLSEYVDESLDAKTKELVEKHLSTCLDCQQEVASLRMLINDLGSMESVAPPKDFLDQLHERMGRRFWLSKAFRALFLPVQARLPMKLAGAAVMVVLVFAIFQVQQDEHGSKIAPLSREVQVADSPPETMEAPLVQEANKAKAMPPVMDYEERIVKKDEPKSPLGNSVEQVVYMKTSTEQPLEKGPPIEWVLVTNRAPSPGLYEATAEVETAPPGEGSMRRTLVMRETAAKGQLERDKKDDDILPKLKEVLQRVGGKFISIEFEEQANMPKSVQVEIPAEKLDTFQNQLKELGDLESTPIGLTRQEQESVPVRIWLFTSQ